MKKLVLLSIATLALAACTDADVVSQRISKDADYFKVNRRIVFYNGITGENMLVIEGLCSLGNSDKARELSVTCKVGPDDYKKHFLGLSDNVTFFSEQIDPIVQDPWHYKVVFKPAAIIPEFNVRN